MNGESKVVNDYPNAGNSGRRSLPTDLDVPSFQSMGNVVAAVFGLYRDNFLSLVKIVAVLCIPLVVAQYVFVNLAEVPLMAVILELTTRVGGLLMSGALIYAVVEFLRTGAFPPLADSYRWGFMRWGGVVLCSFLYTVVVMLGTLALIVPGIIFSVMFALVVPVAVCENTSARRSFDRSSDLTRNYRWQIFFTYFVFSLIIIVVSLVTTAGLGGEATAERSLPFALAQGLITQLLESSSTVLTLFIYLGILRDVNHRVPQVRNYTPAHAPGEEQARPSQVETGREF